MLLVLSERFTEAVRPFDLDVLGRGLMEGLVKTFRYAGIVVPASPELIYRFQDGVPIALEPKGAPRPTLGALLLLPAALWRLLTVNPDTWYERERIPLIQEATDLEQVMTRPDLCSDRELLRVIDRSAKLIGAGFYSRRRYFQSFVLPYLLRYWIGRLGAEALYADLLSGIAHATASANRMLGGLAATAAEDPRIDAALQAPDPAAVLRGTPFMDRLQRFLHEFGSRELWLFGPSWREEPAVVWEMLRSMARRPTPEGASDRSVSGLREALTLIAAPLRPAFRWLLQKVRGLEALREDSHFQMMRPFPIGRAAALELGRRFVDRGLLHRPDDTLFLLRHELVALMDAGAVVAGRVEALQALVAGRRALYEMVRVEGMLPSDWLGAPATAAEAPAARREASPTTGAEAPALGRNAPSTTGASRQEPPPVFRRLLTGTPASSGTAEGPARLIAHPDQFSRLRPGDILVCRYTNPAWTPLFAVAAGVVAETGGAAAHAAIVAREYRIPAVMGARQAMALIQDGQRIRINGLTGEIHVLDGTAAR